MMEQLDPHERPPTRIRDIYKKYQKMKLKELDLDEDIIDPTDGRELSANSKLRIARHLNGESLAAAFRDYASTDSTYDAPELVAPVSVYEHDDMPGKNTSPGLRCQRSSNTMFSFISHILSHLQSDVPYYLAFTYPTTLPTPVLTVSRPPSHPLPPPAHHPTHPPNPPPPPRPLQPHPPHQHPHALYPDLPSPNHPLTTHH